MAKPRFFIENFYNTFQFSGHDIATYTTTPRTGFEAYSVANDRRDPYDYYTPSSTNVQCDLIVACGTSRQADMIAIDRVNNLAGLTVSLAGDDNASFTSPSSIFSITFPSSYVDDDDLTASPGVLTKEGAWLYAFGDNTHQYWRVRISAPGSGLRQRVGGLWLGKSYTPTLYLDQPFEDDLIQSRREERVSDTAWVAATRGAKRRVGTVRLKMADDSEYDTASYHFQDLFQDPYGMWMVFDQEEAENAVFAYPQQGTHGFPQKPGWYYRQAEIPWYEHMPAVS